jgi:C1A family cysteine protease
MFVALLGSALSFEAFPARYTIRGTWNLPYINLTNPITIVVEPTRTYTNKYHGLEQIWTTLGEERFYRKIVTRDNETVCFQHTVMDGQDWDEELVQFLPKPDGFSFMGIRQYNGRLCELWEKNESTPKPQTWRIYINPKTKYPVSYWMKAISIYHSHYDIYILNVDEFFPYALPGTWVIPDICKGDKLPEEPRETQHEDIGFRVRPDQHGTPSWINKLGGRRTTVSNENPEVCKLYKATGVNVPVNFSWRDHPTPVTGPVRNQAACGSCWAFGAAQALESQLALKTGVFRELSVNQLMDCTWEAKNNACDGGESGPAFRSLINKSAGLFLEEDYPYMAVAGYCNSNPQKPVAKIVDCIAIEKTSKALKEAIYKFGPATIGINVIESMLMYTGGVFDDEQCKGAAGDLVHEVLLTGWKVIDGKEAWEVKNSWSSYWGYEGYIYIQAYNQEHNCGVTTDAKIPFIETIKQ